MRRLRYVWVLAVLVMVGLILTGCSGAAAPEEAVLAITNVHARVYESDDDQVLMEVKGSIANDCNRTVERDELPRILQDDEEMDTTYEFPSKKAESLEAWRSLTFVATMPFDPSVEHEWRFEAAENTTVDGIDESIRMVEALHEYQEGKAAEAATAESNGTPGEGYTLQEVVVLARHNVRAPLSTNGSMLATATPYTWHNWTADSSGLTLNGGALETIMGQYVRTWLESEGLFTPNYQPVQGEVRFYANSKQRTMATARYFASGLLPVAPVDIETHAGYDEMDPVFTPRLTFMSESYRADALEQIAEMRGVRKISNVAKGLDDAYALIEDVLDYKNSSGYASGELADLVTNDTQINLELNEEPAMEGSLKTACQLSDALVLQYYEEPDSLKAGFGRELTIDQWKTICSAKDTYGDVLFTAPLVATNVAHPLLIEIGRELDASSRKFTFLCGHDSNIGSVLAALGAEDYELPDSIEAATPIGCMLTFEKWADEDGELYGRIRLIYQSTEQLRNLTPLQNGEVPRAVEMSLEDIEKNDDGLYAYADMRNRIEDATAEYYRMRDAYAEDAAEESATDDAADTATDDTVAEEDELPEAA